MERALVIEELKRLLRARPPTNNEAVIQALRSAVEAIWHDHEETKPETFITMVTWDQKDNQAFVVYVDTERGEQMLRVPESELTDSKTKTGG